MGMKLINCLIFILRFLGEFQAGELMEHEYIYTGSTTSSTENLCKLIPPNDFICDLTNSSKQYIVHITEREANSTLKLKIIRAHKVLLNESPRNYIEIHIENCNDVEASASEYSEYKLYLLNSNASFINVAIKYFKSDKSKIKDLRLKRTEEFDIFESEIGNLKAEGHTLSPSIDSSKINMLDIEISGESYLKITNSTIELVRKLIYSSSKESVCEDSTLQEIEKNAIEISNGQLMFQNILFTADAESFRVHKGTLVFDNITSGLSSDNVVLEIDGTFLYRSRDSSRVFTMTFELEEVFNNNSTEKFLPLTNVMFKDNTLLISLSLLGLVVLIMILIIIMYVVYRKYTLYKENSPHKRSLNDFMSDRIDTEGINRRKGSEYVREADLNNIKPNEEIDYKPRVQEPYVYTDSEFPPPSPVAFSGTSQKTDTLKKGACALEDIQKNYNDIEILGQESLLYSDVEMSGYPNNVEIYSENAYPSEGQSSSQDIMYSDNSYNLGKVNELKNKLPFVFNNSQLSNPNQRSKQFNSNSPKESNTANPFLKPTTTNHDQNFLTGKQNMPNDSFLSRNKDQLHKIELPKQIPPLKPISHQIFSLNPTLNPTLNRTLPPPPPRKVSPKPTTPRPNLPQDEENYYEENDQI